MFFFIKFLQERNKLIWKSTNPLWENCVVTSCHDFLIVISILMLEAKQINSNVQPKSFSIKVWKDCAFFCSFINFKLMEMAEWRASYNNHCPLNWFRVQVITIRKRQPTTIWQICHVKRALVENGRFATNPCD